MSQAYYTSDKGVSDYLLFHYGKDEEILPYGTGPHDALQYPVRSVTELLDPGRLPGEGVRALDLGCAVGRSTFELARICHEVIGIDYSPALIQAAATLLRDGCLPFRYTVEGTLDRETAATRPEGVDPARLHFEVGDAMHLREDLGTFDVVHLANLIDRLSDPAACLARLASLVRPGGQVLLLSPYTWLEDYTPPANWIGGRDGRTTLDGLHTLLDPSFTLDAARDLPFLIREHARKFQWSVAQGTRWIRKG